MQDKELGKSILITGCSSGIGLCSAKILKERGYRVFAAARKQADIEALRAIGLESVLLDVDNSQSIRETLEFILKQTGGTLDALFNNAGIMIVGSIEDLNRNLIRSIFETNTFGPIDLIQQVLPIMRKQGHGRIVQNSSFLGLVSLPYYGAYNASKFAIEGFMNTLRQELADTQITVSIINPGPITSKLRDNAYQTYLQTLAQKQNVHEAVYQKMQTSYFKNKDGIASDPEAVVKKLILALESRHPKAHYYVGVSSHLLAFLRRILPDSALDWVLIKIASQHKPNAA